jgi:hypothetical protein
VLKADAVPMARDHLRVFALTSMRRRQVEHSSDARQNATLSSGFRSHGAELLAKSPLALHGGLVLNAILALLRGSYGNACVSWARPTLIPWH